MAARRRKTVRRRKSTRRRRLGALPVYPNAMGIMGTSAMLGPVVVGLGRSPTEHAMGADAMAKIVKSRIAQLESAVKSAQCSTVIDRTVSLAQAAGQFEAEILDSAPSESTKNEELLDSAFGVIRKAKSSIPEFCRR
jgi:hypothetical protein